MTGYDKYLPQKKERKNVQAKVEIELYNKVREIIDKNDIKLNELVNGLFNKFVDDNKKKKTA